MIWLYILSVCIFETKALYVCPPEKECDGKCCDKSEKCIIIASYPTT